MEPPVLAEIIIGLAEGWRAILAEAGVATCAVSWPT